MEDSIASRMFDTNAQPADEEARLAAENAIPVTDTDPTLVVDPADGGELYRSTLSDEDAARVRQSTPVRAFDNELIAACFSRMGKLFREKLNLARHETAERLEQLSEQLQAHSDSQTHLMERFLTGFEQLHDQVGNGGTGDVSAELNSVRDALTALQSSIQTTGTAAAAIRELGSDALSATSESVSHADVSEEVGSEPSRSDFFDRTTQQGPQDEGGPSVDTAWERIRNSYLAQEGMEDASDSLAELSETAAPVSYSESLSTAALVQGSFDGVPAAAVELDFEIPDPVDPDALDEAGLRAALVERENVISTLASHLRKRFEAAQGMSNEQLKSMADSVPADLAAQVRTTLESLHRQQRISELELSLERARISRQMSRLQHTREIVERRAAQAGLSVDKDGNLQAPSQPGNNSGSKGRRWLGALGFADE